MNLTDADKDLLARKVCVSYFRCSVVIRGGICCSTPQSSNQVPHRVAVNGLANGLIISPFAFS